MNWTHVVQTLWPLLSLTLAERFTVSGPAGPVTARVGTHVVLDCTCSISLLQQGVEVIWFRTRIDSPVNFYSDGRYHIEDQDESYKDRTYLSLEGLMEGDASLTLEDVRVTDNGSYTCLINYGGWYEEATIQLQVTVLGSPPWIRVDGHHNDGVSLLCESNGWFPTPDVLWADGQGDNLTSLSITVARDDTKGLFTIESQIDIKHSTNKVRCVIHTERDQQQAKLQISDQFFPKVPVGLVMSSLMLGLAVLVLIGLIGYGVKQNRGITDLQLTLEFFQTQNNGKGRITAEAVRTLNFNEIPLTPHECDVLSHGLQLRDTIKDPV